MAGLFGPRVIAAVVVAFGLVAGSSSEARASGRAPAPSEAAASQDSRTARPLLEGFKSDLDQKERALERDLSDAELQRLRRQIEPVAEGIRSLIDGLAPRLDAARARLAQLGPKPKEGEPEESADVVRERGEREAGVAELDETQRLGRALLVQAEEIRTQISDRRRAGFTRALFERRSDLLKHWAEIAEALPGEVRAVRTVFGDAVEQVRRNATLSSLLLFGLALGAAIAIYAGRGHVAPRLVARDPAVAEPSRRKRLLSALVALLSGAVPAVVGSFVVWITFDAADFVPARLEPVIAVVLRGVALVAFARALADAILAPGHGAWRLVPVGDAAARRLTTFVVVLGAVVATGKVLEAFDQAIAAALPVTVTTRAVFALAAAALVADLLRRFATTPEQQEASLGPSLSAQGELGGPLRILGWAFVLAVGASVLSGYVVLASFLVDQVVWISSLLAVLLLSIVLIDEFVAGTLRGETRVATMLQANTGLRRRSLEQIGVLANGIARVVLILVAIMLALAPWGVESSDVMLSLRAAFFGFKVGDVTISLATIAVAAFIFALGFAATRVVQRWLDTSFLPATELDAGLRNSIRTGFGYVGIIVAAAMAFSYLGLSLDRITIVAGALSVGIGFGLQSIVNNFVSGLILLWERPIRVGDLVVVGDGEGYVRHINVRATEIETFDRSTILVPNSNLISGVVKNRVRGDRTGRVVVTVPAPRFSDPEEVAGLMRACALAHREVMSEPAARVLFKKVTEQSLELELVCFVDEVDSAPLVSSDLYFAVYRSLRETGIVVPPPPATFNIGGLDEVGHSLKDIAQAIEPHRAGREEVPLPMLAPGSKDGVPRQKQKQRG